MDAYELERLRQVVVKKEIKCAIVIIAIGIVMLLLGLEFSTVFVLCFVFGMMFTMIFTHKPRKEFVQTYKKTVILELFKSMFTDVTYDLDRGIPKSVIADTGMMNMGDRYHSNDYMTAKYKDVPFAFSDVKIEEEYRDSDGDTHYTTVFRGQWYIFDFNKKFKADIQVCEKNFSNARRGSLFSSERFKKIQLEDIEFNKEFKVFAKNDLEAFYILTPNTMEKIKEVNRKVRGALLFCFVNNKLHIGVDNNCDLFEPKIHAKIDIEKNTKQAREEIQFITHFVDILNLNNDLFRREV